MDVVRRRVLTAVIVGCGVIGLAAGALGTPVGALAASPPAYNLVGLGSGTFGGEPSITADGNGVIYDTTPGGEAGVYRSLNHGAAFTCPKHDATVTPPACTGPDTVSGDNCLATDQLNALYYCNLAGSQSTGPLQADVWKSTDQGNTWMYGTNTINMGGQNICGTSCSPFAVDRQWVDASTVISPNTPVAKSEVVLMYHDFGTLSQIWVNISTDGGQTFGPPSDVLAHLNTSNPNATVAANAAVAAADSACNTVPSGVRIEKSGPHIGRIYLGWIAADPAQNVTGCNLSMDQSFHNLIVAWSDDNGATWTPQLAFDAGIGHDASTPFAAFTIDDQGNPYFGFNSQGPSQNPVVCAAESAAGTEGSDPTCGYDMFVVWSSDGGTTWDGGGGTVPNSAAAAYQANPASQTGTDQFATIAAGDPGKVDVSYLHTDQIEPSDPQGKFEPLGCDGGDNGTGTAPSNYPPRCHWNLFAGQSLNLTSTTSTATWSNTQVTSVPLHFGDICNLGIACAQQVSPAVPRDPRHLLDFNMATVDPTTGCVHFAYSDDNSGSTYGDASNPSPFGGQLVVANQTSGTSVLGSGICGASVSGAGTSATPSPTAAALAQTGRPEASTGNLPDGRLVLAIALLAVALLGGGAAYRRRRTVLVRHGRHRG